MLIPDQVLCRRFPRSLSSLPARAYAQAVPQRSSAATAPRRAGPNYRSLCRQDALSPHVLVHESTHLAPASSLMPGIVSLTRAIRIHAMQCSAARSVPARCIRAGAGVQQLNVIAADVRSARGSCKHDRDSDAPSAKLRVTLGPIIYDDDHAICAFECGIYPARMKHDASCKIARTADDGGACGGKYRL